MQALSHSLYASPPCSSCGSRSLRPQRLASSLLPARRPRRGPAKRLAAGPQAFGGAAAAFPGSFDEPNLGSTIGLLLAAGLMWLLLREEEAVQRDDTPECATCGGTGLEDCACQRWSDGDVGCSTCHGSGKSVCRSCNGGGTAVPIAAKAVKRNYNRYNMDGGE